MIKEGATVEVNYELFIDDENGEMVESTLEQGPMKFTFKVDPMIEGFEKGLAGLNAGDEFRISIPCAEAYGDDLGLRRQRLLRRRPCGSDPPPPLPCAPRRLGRRSELAPAAAVEATAMA